MLQPGASFNLAAHVKYFVRCLQVLPAPYASLDTNPEAYLVKR